MLLQNQVKEKWKKINTMISILIIEQKSWKISDKTLKKAVFSNKSEKDTKFPAMQVTEKGLMPTLLKTYPQLHSYHVNSLSVCSNGENFISGDDLRVNLWTLDRIILGHLALEIKETVFVRCLWWANDEGADIADIAVFDSHCEREVGITLHLGDFPRDSGYSTAGVGHVENNNLYRTSCPSR